jgi:heme oxygenase
MNVLQEVRSVTRPHHEEMEAVALSDKIAARSLNLDEYKAIILGHFVFHREAENLLMKNEELGRLETLAFTERRKLDLLARDIEVLQLEPYLFDFHLGERLDSIPRALGCMYVMEGATLGGTVIKRSLKQVPEIVDSGAMSYYAGYGRQTGSRWKQFKDTVIQQVVSEEDEQVFIETASATFRAYAACMEKAKQQLSINFGNS